VAIHFVPNAARQGFLGAGYQVERGEGGDKGGREYLLRTT